MPTNTMAPTLDRTAVERASPAAEPARSTSGVSWGAILAGATAAAAVSLIMLILGTGLGMAAVSPWAGAGIGATTFGVTTIVWITFTQLVASGTGGYLAGRLRTKWAGVHTDEVYFRDTAHGMLAWAAAALASAALLGSTIGSIVSSGAQTGATLAGGAAAAAAPAVMRAGASSDGAGAYFVDSLFRRDTGTPTDGAPPAAEAARIFTNALRAGSLPADDARYLGQVVAQRTSLSPADAEKRVTDTFTRMQTAARDAEATAKEAADKARKATAYGSLWLFVSLLVGAFVASYAATVGGRQRDA